MSVGSLRFDDDMRAARDVLQSYESGLDLMICRLTDPEPASVLDRLRRIGREVLPALQLMLRRSGDGAASAGALVVLSGQAGSRLGSAHP